MILRYCDICKKKITFNPMINTKYPIVSLNIEWTPTHMFTNGPYDLCHDCMVKIADYVEKLRQEETK